MSPKNQEKKPNDMLKEDLSFLIWFPIFLFSSVIIALAFIYFSKP